MSHLVLADMGAARLAGGLTPDPGPATDWALLLTVASAVVVVNATLWLAWRWMRRDPLERAFVLCAARARLGRRARRAVRTLAQAIGQAPVALLLSEHALREAERRVMPGAIGPGEVALIRRRLFS